MSDCFPRTFVLAVLFLVTYCERQVDNEGLVSHLPKIISPILALEVLRKERISSRHGTDI